MNYSEENKSEDGKKIQKVFSCKHDMDIISGPYVCSPFLSMGVKNNLFNLDQIMERRDFLFKIFSNVNRTAITKETQKDALEKFKAIILNHVSEKIDDLDDIMEEIYMDIDIGSEKLIFNVTKSASEKIKQKSIPSNWIQSETDPFNSLINGNKWYTVADDIFVLMIYFNMPLNYRNGKKNKVVSIFNKITGIEYSERRLSKFMSHGGINYISNLLKTYRITHSIKKKINYFKLTFTNVHASTAKSPSMSINPLRCENLNLLKVRYKKCDPFKIEVLLRNEGINTQNFFFMINDKCNHENELPYLNDEEVEEKKIENSDTEQFVEDAFIQFQNSIGLSIPEFKFEENEINFFDYEVDNFIKY